MMPRKKISYANGDVFVIPLRGGGFGRGVVARMDGKGTVFGYFFGPRLSSVKAASTFRLACEASVCCAVFGDLGLLNGEWQVVGRLQDWQEEDWPLPPFGYQDDGSGRCYLRYYDDTRLTFLREEESDTGTIRGYPRDGCAGYGAVEIRLTELLR